MRVSMRTLDFWLAKGFGGIINMLHTRVTQIGAGFTRASQLLMVQETRRMAELNDSVQANRQEEDHPQQTDLVTVDNWFIKAFTGLDLFLSQRSEDEATPISDVNLSAMELHVKQINAIITKEKEKKCHASRGSK